MAGSAEESGSSLKRRNPGLQARASDVKTFDGNHDMNNSTAVSNVIPFRFDKKEVRTLLIDDQPWFVAVDVCNSLSIVNVTRALSRLDDDEKALHSMKGTRSMQELNVVNESGLYSLILTSRKEDARRFKKWITSEVLPAIRKHGHYVDHHGAMGDLVGAVIGTSGEHVLDRVIDQKASPVPHSLQRSFKHTMKSRLRSRFNVPRTALIPAEYLNDACNFVAAYSLEGEWIGRASLNTHELTDKELYDVGFLIHHFLAVKGIYERWGVGSALRMLGSPIPAEITDHFSDAMMAIGGLKKRSADMDVAANRLGLRNGKATRSAAA